MVPAPQKEEKCRQSTLGHVSIDVLAEFANPLSSALSQRHVEEALFSLLYLFLQVGEEKNKCGGADRSWSSVSRRGRTRPSP